MTPTLLRYRDQAIMEEAMLRDWKDARDWLARIVVTALIIGIAMVASAITGSF